MLILLVALVAMAIYFVAAGNSRRQAGPTAWQRMPAEMPVALGEVGSAIVQDTLYVFGYQTPQVMAYDFLDGTWRGADAVGKSLCTCIFARVQMSTRTAPSASPLSLTRLFLAPRLFSGDHHSAQVIDDRLYCIGGLRGDSEGILSFLR